MVRVRVRFKDRDRFMARVKYGKAGSWSRSRLPEVGS